MWLYLTLFLSIIILLISIVAIIRLKLYQPKGQYGFKGVIFSVLVGILFISSWVLISTPVVSPDLVNWPTRNTARPTPTTVTSYEIQTVEVIVALQPLEPGSQFVEGSIGRRPWPAASVPPDVIGDEIETIGTVAKKFIAQGQIIDRSMLMPISLLEFFPAPVIAEGIAYVGRNDGILYALDTQTGQELWRFHAARPMFSTPTVTRGKVYFSDDDGTLYALEAQTGQEIWRITSPNHRYILEPATPVVIRDIVFFENRSDGFFYAIDAQTGQEIWRRQASIARVADGKVYFMTRDGAVATTVDMETGQPVDLQSGQQD